MDVLKEKVGMCEITRLKGEVMMYPLSVKMIYDIFL